MAEKVDQDVDGNGNIFSGRGPVTVNKIIHIHSAETPEPEKVDSAGEAKLGTPFGVPNLPPRYLERDDYLDQFREALLSKETQMVGITGRPQYVGVQGMGGLGKSVLAAALAWDEQVRRAFPDGIFWLRFGQEVDEAGLLELQKEILLILATDSQPESPAQGQNLLNLALQGKRCLIIADDLWDSSHLNHFDLADSGCRFLLTTRDAEVIEGTGARLCELHLLSDKQARELLAKCSGFVEEDLPEEAEAILRECNRLPLAVAAIGSMVNGKGRSRWQLALDKLQNARLDKIPAKFDRYSGYENLFKVFQVSVEDLPSEVQAYYKTLLVFPEDAQIPESVLQLYWEHLGQEDYEPLEAVDLLVQRSLLSPAGEELFTLHDLLRDYLVFQADGEVAELHRQMLEAYKAAYRGEWHMIPYVEHFYFYRYWQFHIQAAGEIALASVIADALIRKQELLTQRELQNYLQVVDYQFFDIAPCLLKNNKHPHVLISCLKILGYDAKEDAKRLLNEHDNLFLITTCFEILGAEAEKYARRFLQENNKVDIQVACLKLLGNDAKEDARRLIKKSHVREILCTCLNILWKEAREDAWRLLKDNKNADVLTTCLKILGKEAKEDAQQLLKESKDHQVILTCLKILNDEAKEDARQLLKENKDHQVIVPCLKILGDEAKEDARHLLKSNKDEGLLVTCISILGQEAKADAIRLSKTGKTRLTRENCRDFLREWDENSLGSQFPELARLKKNLADK